MKPTIILVRPREEGNVGMVARAMANMGFAELVLVEPAAKLGGVARGFGVGAWHILDSCARADNLADALAPMQRVIGTAAARQRSFDKWRVLDAKQMATEIAASPQLRTAVVFGPEDTGLTSEELEFCQSVVTVPCAAQHPTLNLAQAVLLVTYELSQVGPNLETQEQLEDSRELAEATATGAEIETLFAKMPPLLDQLGYDQPHLQGGLMSDLRRLVSRSPVSSREIRILLRLVNRAQRRISTSSE